MLPSMRTQRLMLPYVVVTALETDRSDCGVEGWQTGSVASSGQRNWERCYNAAVVVIAFEIEPDRLRCRSSSGW